MLAPPHVRARRRLVRRFTGPLLAALIIGAGAYYFFGPPSRAGAAPLSSVSEANSAPTAVRFANCDAARAAGAAPVRRGQAGYAAHLDRDNDGVGCEPYARR